MLRLKQLMLEIYYKFLSFSKKCKLQFLKSVMFYIEKSDQPLPRFSNVFRGIINRQQDYVADALLGAISFQLMRAGYNVGLFELLHKKSGLTLSEIANHLDLKPYTVESLLLGLVPLRFVEKIDLQYFNNPLLSSFLADQLNDGEFGSIIEYFDKLINPSMEYLEESIKQNKPIGLHKLFGEEAISYYGELAKNKKYNRYFQDAMRADSQLNRDRVASSAIFANRSRILDIGGNIGEMAIALAKFHSSTQVTVFDFPEVVAQAEIRFKKEGLSDRLNTVGGNIITDEFPQPYDCILFSHFIDIFSREKVIEFFRRSFACLDPGGIICVFGSTMYDNETGPLLYGVLSSYFLCLADGEGRFYTAAQTVEALRATGFISISKQVLPLNEVFICGVKMD